MSKQKTSKDFKEMDILMGGNPNYGDVQKLKYNKKTGLLEDSSIIKEDSN